MNQTATQTDRRLDISIRSFPWSINAASLIVAVVLVEMTLGSRAHWWWSDLRYRIVLDLAGVAVLVALVAIHEWAHALVLARKGPVEIRLSPSLGTARAEDDIYSPSAILAGPAANIAAGAVLYLALRHLPSTVPYIGQLLVAWAADLSIMLGVTNLIPTGPLDGFRFLDSLCDRITNPAHAHTARLVVGAIGLAVAIALVVFAVGAGAWIAVAVASFAAAFDAAWLLAHITDNLIGPLSTRPNDR